MIIIPRKSWGARFAAGFGPAPKATELWLHHSVTHSAGEQATEAQDAATIRALEDIGQQRFGGGISYTFAVCRSGRVFEGTGGLRLGAHTGGRNSRARAVVLVDDCTTRRPSDAMIVAVAELIRYGRAAGYWSVDELDGGHRDAPNAATSCPGNAAYAVIPVINSRATTPHLAERPTLEADDMTPEDRDRLARVEAGVTLLLQQMIGPGATITEPWPGPERGGGWPTWRYGDEGRTRLTLVDYLRLQDRETLSGFYVGDAPTNWQEPTTAVGHVLAVRALALQLEQLVRALGSNAAPKVVGA